MGRSRNVSDDDLDSAYLNEMTGDEGNTDENAVTDETPPAQGPTGPDDDDAGTESVDDGGGKPNGSRPTRTEPPAPKGPARGATGPQAHQPKVNLTDAQQRQVYHAIKDRLQPVFNAQNRQMNVLRNENSQIKAQLKVYTDRDNVAREHNLTPLQQAQSYQLMAALLRDPPATIRYLIDKATANGHNLTGILGQGAQVGPSPQAIKDMIAEAVQPLTREATARQEQQQLRAEAQGQLNEFYSDFPDAQVHEDVLNQMLQRDPNLSLHRALFELKDYYSKHGLDWSVPLQVHVQQRRAGNGQQPQHTTQQPLNMRGSNGAAFEQPERGNGAVREAPPSASFRDIVKEQMRLAGFNVSNL